MQTIACHEGVRHRRPEGRSTAALATVPRLRERLAIWAPVLGKGLLVVLSLVALSMLGNAALAKDRRGEVPSASGLAPPSLPAPEPSAPAQAAPVAPNESAPTEPAAAESDAPNEAPKQAPAVLPDGRIVLNLAGEAELVKLPGVGAKRAQAILEVRRRLGRFRRVEDLLRVKGIGRKMLERIRPLVVVDPPRAGA